MDMIDWGAANVLAVIAIGVPAAIALYLAGQSTRYQMDHRDFERNREASIDCLERLQDVYPAALEGSPQIAQATLNALSLASQEWQRLSSAHDLISSFFTDKESVCIRAAEKAERGEWSETVEMEVANALQQLREVITDWPYPERRRATMRQVLTDMASDPERPSYGVPVHLQVERWLLVSLPSPYRIVRGWRATAIWLRLAWVDVRRGALGERFRNWRMMRRTHRHEMRLLNRGE